MLMAMLEDRSADDPRPEFFLEPQFINNRYLCGLYSVRAEDETSANSYHIYIAHLAHLNFGGPDEQRALPVQVVSRDASEAELDEYCPNLPADLRTDLLNPEIRHAVPPVDFDPEAAGMMFGRQGEIIMWSLDRIYPEWPDGTHTFDWGFPAFREQDRICAEYLISTPEQRAWTPHWLIARIDSFSPVTARPSALPLTLLNGDANPQEVLSACPSLANWDEFETLMTPQDWYRSGKVQESIERSLTPALINRFQEVVPADSGITASYAGEPNFYGQGTGRVCGTIPVRLTSEHATEPRQAFVADIDATRLTPGETSPFPMWDVRIVDVFLPESADAFEAACPSLTTDSPDGYGLRVDSLFNASFAESISAHRRGERVCQFWDDDDSPQSDASRPDYLPEYPREISGEPCRRHSRQTADQIRDRQDALFRETADRLPME